MKQESTVKIERYVPVSTWNATGEKVKFAFTYPTQEEAAKHGKRCEEVYKDQKFIEVALVCKMSSCNEAAYKDGFCAACYMALNRQ